MHLELVTMNTSNKLRKFKKNFKKKQMQDMAICFSNYKNKLIKTKPYKNKRLLQRGN